MGGFVIKLRGSKNVSHISPSILRRIGKELLSTIPTDFIWRSNKAYNKVVEDKLDNGAKHFVVYEFEMINGQDTVTIRECKKTKR